MAQFLNFRNFLFLPSLPLSSKPSPHLRFLSTLVSSSSSPRRRNVNVPPLHLSRRYTKTTAPMVELKDTTSSGTSGFNKRRAEGTDKTDFPKKNLQLKIRKLNPINTISYVQILGTGMDTQDTSPAVMLFFDKQRFIFNAGEGLQRFCTEHRIKLSKIDHIFLSRVCSETAGGLPGLLLTLAGMGDEGMSVNMWGPSDLKYLVDAMRSFIPNAAMVHTKSFGPTFGTNESNAKCQNDPIVLVDDEVVKISAIILQPCQSPSQKTDHGTDVDSLNGKKLSAAKPGDMSVIYICELPEIKGKFDPEKAKALGLRPGPKYRELQLGNSVESDRQNVMVHPSDVMDPSIPGPIVLVVDCPTESHLEAILSAKSLATYGDQVGNLPKAGKSVSCVIHLTPESVVRRSNYQNWMKTFGSAQHIMAGHEKKNVEVPILKASARIATRLNYLCPRFFPAPGFWSLANQNCSKPGSLASSEDSLSALSNVISAENLLKFTLRPYVNLGLDRSSIPTKVSSSEIIDELLWEIPEVVEAAQQVSQLWQDSSQTKEDPVPVADHQTVIEEPWLCEDGITPACLENIRRDDLEIVLLGTGSSQPSKYRNVTSIYINLFSKGGVLLDCGEGTLGQLKRRYGVSGADDVVRSLTCIWISHIHADHHTGLARILALRRDLLKGVPHEPVLVVGPRKLKRYLDAYQRLENLDMLFLDCKHTLEASLNDFENDLQETVTSQDLSNNNAETNASKLNSTLFAKGSQMQSYWKRPGSPVDKDAVYPLLRKLKGVIQEAGLSALISFPVVHCPQSYGVVLQAEKSRGFVNIVQDGDDVASSFSAILRLLDPTPSYVLDGSSSTIENPPGNHGVVNLFREIKEIFCNSTSVSSFDQTTTIRVQYLVEKLRPLRHQLLGANHEAFIAFEKFFTSLEANTTLLAVIPTHDQVTASMNEIRREALASKTAAETLVETRDQKRQDISNRSVKIDLLEHQLAELRQAQIDDINEINHISSKLAQGMEDSKAVFTRVMSVKETLAALSFSYNRAIAVHQELDTLLKEAVRHASI